MTLSEEQVTIGKRMVDRGTTRVRRYVVERPVDEQVTLRGERVTVERRRPGIDRWQGRRQCVRRARGRGA